MESLAWVILFLPLLAAGAITLFTQQDRGLSARLSIGAIVLSFVLSIILFAKSSDQTVADVLIPWLSVGNLHIDFGLRLDSLSLLMLLIVTGVGGAIHIYSYGYMQEDRSLPRYFASLSFFTFSMLGIVLASNFVQMFIFWELVGVSSYLLIGFWYKRPAAADACKKAFLTNRVGDFGFMLGIIVVWGTLGSVSFGALELILKNDPNALGRWATIAGLLIFCGAVGKSAQFPLHVWLPDAMEGPTPVSALIHAATMVAAGVYMLCRVFFLLNPAALLIVAWVGGVTALLAALIAIQQNDIKRILAYSTLSQLGYMVMSVGLGGPAAAMYHLTTHAFFKALLFLGAGSVIHALHHEQNIWNMGGLSRKMRTTYWTFLIATLALCGVPPLSGFFSKDEILATAYQQSTALFVLAGIVAGLTAFYMFRLVFVAFLGRAKSPGAEHPHESPRVMTVPLVALAVPSLLAGFWGIDLFIGRAFPRLAGETHALPWYEHILAPFNHSPLAALFGLFATVIGFSVALRLYANASRDPLPQRLGALSRALRNGFYFDELYNVMIAATQENFAKLADWLDRWIIAGMAVRGTHGTTEFLGRALRMLQTGNLQTYAFLFVVGVTLLLYFTLK